MNHPRLEIVSIPAFKDNYIWLGINHMHQQAFVVDPGEAASVLAYLQQHHLSLTAILLTHKHADHTGGVLELLGVYPDASVYAHARENLSFVTHRVNDNDILSLSVWPEAFKVIYIPGHTMGHVAYYAKPALFCGDTLFSAGCGRIFEGTAAQMLASLDKLAALPDDTLVYCGHEYTLSNLRFAAQVEPDNVDIASYIEVVKALRVNNKPSLPSSLQKEKQVNPFLRSRQRSVIAAVEKHANCQSVDPVAIFHALREWKNKF